MTWDLSLLPVFTMFFLQIKPQLNVLVKALVYSSVISFGAEPLFMWLDYYEYPNWQYIYSFFNLFIYPISHYLATRNKFGSLNQETTGPN
ncbi:CBO0543 family protein [Lentibacillus sp.]|uniref:CBO0543 family protein n=1 Tax=Lentibacillus sp. TaxID=1925746 RepID=UPI0039C91FC7